MQEIYVLGGGEQVFKLLYLFKRRIAKDKQTLL